MIFFAIIASALVFLQASCASSIGNFLTAPYTAWFPIAALAVLCFTAVVIVIYMLAPLLGDSGSVRSWSRTKIYELITSLILIIIFATVATSICTFDPTSALNSVGLISSSCTSGTNSTIYSTSLCDLYNFNSYVLHFNEYLYLIRVSFATQLSWEFDFQFGSTILGPGVIKGSSGPLGFAPTIGVAPGIGGGLGDFGTFVMPVIYIFILINQLQLLLLAAAPLIFAIFMAIGLISRAFGVARSFGGAMIAFGLGIGLIYPLLIAVNYGFLDHALEQASILGTGAATLALPVYSPLLTLVLMASAYVSGSSLLAFLPEYLFVYVGLIFIGVVFMDIFNFVILDTFITDFSQAVGERIGFLTLLESVL